MRRTYEIIEYKKRDTKQKNAGITLVALVITIIVLLILVGVVIRLAVGENGLIIRAKDSANKYNQAQDYEIGVMDDVSKEYDSIMNGNWMGGGSGNNPRANPGGNTTIPGGDNPNPPSGGGNLTDGEKDKLEENGIKELEDNEITNENLKDNDNIKGVIEGEVPIPEGSDYVEGTKDTGVVVAFGDNEFVWVPVPNIDEMAVLQSGSDVNYQGVLYSFSGTTATKREIGKIGSGKGYREPDTSRYAEFTQYLSIVNNILGTNYETADQFKTALQVDYNEMVESVKKYKGFYMGRYETSLDENKKAKSRVGVLPVTAAEDSTNTWYGLYAYQKKMAEDNGLISVKSHMIWGSNYNAMLRWALTGEDAAKIDERGNAYHYLNDVYETGKETVEGKVDRINNIYDLEGNLREWTMENISDYGRLAYGGLYGDKYNNDYTPSFYSAAYVSYADPLSGSRIALYIK